MSACVYDDGGITYLPWCYTHDQEYRKCLDVDSELIDKTISQQMAKIQTYQALKDRDLPIPADLKAEVEAIKVEQTLASQIIEVVLSDLHGRQGVGDALDEVEFNTYAELVECLEEKVQDLLDRAE